MTQFEPGMRVRCVDARNFRCLSEGKEYKVHATYTAHDGAVVRIHRIWGLLFYANRFKPIVRVKMGRAAA